MVKSNQAVRNAHGNGVIKGCDQPSSTALGTPVLSCAISMGASVRSQGKPCAPLREPATRSSSGRTDVPLPPAPVERSGLRRQVPLLRSKSQWTQAALVKQAWQQAPSSGCTLADITAVSLPYLTPYCSSEQSVCGNGKGNNRLT